MQQSVSESWWEVVCELPIEHAQDLSACLAEAGSLAVEVVETHDPSLPPLPFPKAQPSSPAHALVVAGFAHEDGEAQALAVVQNTLEELGLTAHAPLVVSLRNDGDWAWKWKEFFAPLNIGTHVWIVPTWDTSFTAPPESTVLRLDPGMAFGTGQHETTSLCIEAIEAYATQHPGVFKNPSFQALDVGSGTGVLALALAALGCPHVLATDNDPEAVQATQANALLNHLQNNITASSEDVSTLTHTYPFVVANILAHTLIELVQPMVRLLPQQSYTLLLSGILDIQAQDVVQAYTTQAHAVGKTSFHLHHTWSKGSWVALEFRG
jgi:ribosomal protein L11 methyltransferase